MKRWPTLALGEVMATQIDAVPATSLPTANLAGVYGFGRGLFRRGQMSPIETTYKSFHRLRAGDFVISSPKAWEGAIARIPEDLDGWFLSPVFPTFRADETRLDTRYLNWYCKREQVWRQLQGKAKGMGARRESVSPAQFLSIEVPLPALTEQQAIVARLDALADKSRQLTAHLDAIEADADQLLAQQFQAAIAGAPYRPMSEVAPLVRRQVAIAPDVSYPELGIRSFGKGTFHKPAVPGMELGNKRLFRIEAGDLLFSNVFAWEGAIAIAGPADAGRFGSHRFMTCVVDEGSVLSSFLLYYLLAPEGLEKVREASPGGAGRNRTLGVEKLARLTVPIPPLAVQQAFVDLQATISALKTRHAAIRADNVALLPATLERLFATS